jgi:hypothetical protein
MLYFWISLAIAVACSLGSAYIASNKGRNIIGYAILGFFLPLIGLIVAAVVPSKRP